MDYLFILVLGYLLGRNMDRIKAKFIKQQPVPEKPVVITETRQPVTEKPKKRTKEAPSCEVCQGEKDIFLGKQRIKCPSCYGWDAQAK
ncbi:hypothetical protein HWB91_gp15 [Bacillus phage vB_BboS-125]|uniref:Uncharacterized protein n=1 Tax=Bacillus phage vB_BboS-125 TaxID=2419618 RepID=A0A3G3BVU1_9CAUD|nr:hypothetical protein HWB91_gp15 [Bacillus phage vB_BboS-125]AYP68385.1 hypothetical protein BboS125_00015 [Bacillus phage vB_BboS-125]